MSEQRKKLRLGELLIQQGLITPDQLRIALTEQKNQQAPLGRLLVRLGFVTEAVIRDIMARTIGQESIDLTQVVVDGDALKLIPQDFARRHRLLPIAFDNNERVLTVAITEVFNVVALDQLRSAIGQQVKIRTVLAGEAQLEDSIDTPGAFWTELWAPVGLRYHALHHFFPGIPYHNLGIAYRRIVAAVPQDSLFLQSTSPSLGRSLSELLRKARAAGGRMVGW